MTCRTSDIARTFGEGFAKQLSAMEHGPLAGADLVELRSSISSSSTNERREACRRSMPSGRPCSGSGQNARRIEAEQKLYRTLRDRYEIVVETPLQGRVSRDRAMRCFAILLGVFGVLLGASSAVG